MSIALRKVSFFWSPIPFFATALFQAQANLRALQGEGDTYAVPLDACATNVQEGKPL